MFWAEEEGETATTWQEVSTFYRAWLKSIFCSEFDYAERGPICYAKDTQEKEEIPGPGLDFAPLIFQSVFYIHTKKGCVYKKKSEYNFDWKISQQMILEKLYQIIYNLS